MNKRYGIKSKAYDTENQALLIKLQICKKGIVSPERIRVYKDVKVWRWIVSPYTTYGNAMNVLIQIKKQLNVDGFVIEI